MIIGLDISTSVVGVAVFDSENYNLQELCYLKFKVGTNLFVKLNEFVEFFEKKFKNSEITNIHIEEPLKKFKGKFSNADTIQKLTQINAMISGYLYNKLKIEPVYFNVQTARSIVFPELSIPKSHPNKKHLIWEAVMKVEPKITWLYSNKTHALKDVNFDMCDAWVAGMAGIIMIINQKNSRKLNYKL